jgi:uncharacterized protein YndB with AHSA1/START domain
MISAESAVVLSRPVEEVWAFVSDPRNEPKWHTDILAIKSEADPSSGPEGSWDLGSTWLVTVQFMGRRDYVVQITGLEPNRRVEITTKTGPMKPVATYLFEPANGGTRFTRHVDLPVQGPLRIMKGLIRKNLQKRNATFVQNLKDLLER